MMENGTAIVAGVVGEKTNLMTRDSGVLTAGSASKDACFVAVDPQGEALWGVVFGGPSGDVVSDMLL
jgi:hypothetical protein